MGACPKWDRNVTCVGYSKSERAREKNGENQLVSVVEARRDQVWVLSVKERDIEREEPRVRAKCSMCISKILF